MTEHRSPQDIEGEIERERAGLTRTLDDLQDRFSIDGVVRQVSDQFRDHGGEIAASVSRSVRENPMALALTGVGLAWMIFGSRPHDDGRDRGYEPGRRIRRETRSYRPDDDRSPKDIDGGSRNYGSYLDTGRDSRAPDTSPSWMRSFDDSHGRPDDRDASRNVAERAGGAADAAGNRISAAAGSVSDAAGSTMDRVRDAGASMASGAGAARDRTTDAARRAADQAASLRDRLSEGTEALGEEARERVIDARQRAIEARDAASDYARRGRDRAVDMFEEQPLVAGALALAVGAAIGAALPRTSTEDSYFGTQSDDLFHEAERIFAEEREKAVKVASAAVDEAKSVMNETRDQVEDKAAKVKAEADRDAPADTAAQAVADKTRQAGQRIADAAKTEAEKQNLGKANI